MNLSRPARIPATGAVAGIALLVFGAAALGHGTPTIRVDPAVVAAGGTVTCVGTDMPAGAEFVITLERAGRSLELGRAIAAGQDEGGFTVRLAVPTTVAPGSYTVRAVSASGKVATADLTVTEAATAPAEPGTPAMLMPSAALHELDRTKTGAEVAGALAAIVALAAVGARSLRAAA